MGTEAETENDKKPDDAILKEASEKGVPYLLDLTDNVAARLIESVEKGPDQVVLNALGGLLTAPFPDADLLPNCRETFLINLIMYARGCHEAAIAHREKGLPINAALYEAVGQDLLTRAIVGTGKLMDWQPPKTNVH